MCWGGRLLCPACCSSDIPALGAQPLPRCPGGPSAHSCGPEATPLQRLGAFLHLRTCEWLRARPRDGLASAAGRIRPPVPPAAPPRCALAARPHHAPAGPSAPSPAVRVAVSAARRAGRVAWPQPRWSPLGRLCSALAGRSSCPGLLACSGTPCWSPARAARPPPRPAPPLPATPPAWRPPLRAQVDRRASWRMRTRSKMQ